jgi:cyclic pyranopterin phosphate synthase
VENAVISVGSACSARCVFCRDGAARVRRRADPAHLEALLERFAAEGVRRAVLLGGEPTVHPELTRLAASARRAGFASVELSTNGLRLGDEAYARSLLSAGVTRVTMSLHSPRAEIEDALTRVPGAWRRKLAAVRILVGLEREGLIPEGLLLNPVLCASNLADLRGLVDLAAGLGARRIHFNYVGGSTYMSPTGAALRRSGLVPPLRAAAPRILDLIVKHRAGRWPGLRLGFSDVPPCALERAAGPAAALAAAPYVEDKPSRTRVRAGGRWVDWDDWRRKRFLVQAPACASCRFARGCAGILRHYAAVHGLSEFATPAATGRA